MNKNTKISKLNKNEILLAEAKELFESFILIYSDNTILRNKIIDFLKKLDN